MTATINLIEVSNTIHNGDEALDYSYSTLVLLMERGHFIEVYTFFDKESKRWVSEYTWMWLKTHGLGHKWIPGDPVMTNGKPWVRKNPDLYTMDNTTLQAKAHRDAVASLLVLNQSSVYEPAMYMGKPIPSLFTFNVKPDAVDDPILKQEDAIRQRRIAELRAKHTPASSYMMGDKDIKDLLKQGQLKCVEMTGDDFTAIIEGKNIVKNTHYIPMSDNYALGA
jgi:hypothetical protein